VFRHSSAPRTRMKAMKRDGRVAFEPIDDGREYDVVSEFNMGSSIYMTPIVANNVMYIATKDVLYAIALSN
jgi:hypothetical protein